MNKSFFLQNGSLCVETKASANESGRLHIYLFVLRYTVTKKNLSCQYMCTKFRSFFLVYFFLFLIFARNSYSVQYSV